MLVLDACADLLLLLRVIGAHPTVGRTDDSVADVARGAELTRGVEVARGDHTAR
jgi:hypothetical protein